LNFLAARGIIIKKFLSSKSVLSETATHRSNIEFRSLGISELWTRLYQLPARVEKDAEGMKTKKCGAHEIKSGICEVGLLLILNRL
jgi:hypothetical protein